MINNAAVGDAVKKSIDVILENQQPSGAYPASPNFAPYQYSWFRDGSFIADGMSRAGEIESAENFFAWGSAIITERRDHILAGGTLDARYTYDGNESTEAWANLQLDGYGVFLWAMKQHATRHNVSIEQFQEAAGLIQYYLMTHWQDASFDWWEERQGRHTASLACIYAGLAAYEHPEAGAVQAAISFDETLTDSSLLVCGIFNAVTAEQFAPILARIEAQLVSETGGVYRYHDDVYYGGGEWPVLTALLGWYYAKTGNHDAAQQKLDWCISHMRENGWLAEQSSERMLHPDQYQLWIEKWGEPANPLLWSQAMLLSLASEL